MNNKGKLIVLSAPSGAGKTTICKELLKRNKDWLFSISVTTREKRENEINGVDYLFISKEKFEGLDKFGELLESEWVHGNRYGTQIVPLEQALDNGDTMLIDVDVKGAMNLIEEYEDDLISIFIEPPGINDQDKRESLSDRLQKRGNTNETLIKQRLKRYDLELSYKEKFSFNYVNEKLDDAINKIEKYIKENI